MGQSVSHYRMKIGVGGTGEVYHATSSSSAATRSRRSVCNKSELGQTLLPGFPRACTGIGVMHPLWLGPSGSFMDLGFSVGFFLNNSVE